MNSNILSGILQSLFSQSPVLIVALVACIVTILNWQQSPSASMFSLLGFGLTLLVCLAAPITQILAMHWMMPGAGGTQNTRYLYLLTVLSLFWSVIRAASYCLLLAAVYTGRQEPRTMTPAAPGVPR